MRELSLSEIFHEQFKLNERMNHPMGHLEAGIKENVLAAQVELVEVLNEINWKPWKRKRKRVNEEALFTELTDVLQFWVNACICAGATPEDISRVLRAKWLVNHQRVDEEYGNDNPDNI